METEMLYFPNVDACYLREFDANVIDRGPDYAVLDCTLFYPEGGGQPWDTGQLRWDGGQAKVTKVLKEKGVVKHFVNAVPTIGEVHGIIDWDRRYAHMRMHTSQHLLSGLAFRIFGSRTVGNQIHADRSRVDLQPAHLEDEHLKRLEDACNEAIAAGVAVRIAEEDRALVENRVEDRALMDLIPKSIRRLRVVQITGFDYCPCGGTHVRNTAEIGRMTITERRSKGKETDRVTYTLAPHTGSP